MAPPDSPPLFFPPVETASEEGLLDIGGDLSTERLLLAYRSGIYPCYGVGEPILWWSPNPRGIIPLNDPHIGKTLRKVLNRAKYEIKINSAFEETIEACSRKEWGDDRRWITDEMIDAYINLHRLGHAHSVETWFEGELVGGLYGVAIGGLFAGESMFSKMDNSSKVAMVALVERMNRLGYTLLDCQMVTEVTGQMGAIEITRKEYMGRLNRAMEIEPLPFG
ncbi:MAG: leucyl/phenylalanyl-tRNA--protein transferase [Nitrospinota bacterium]